MSRMVVVLTVDLGDEQPNPNLVAAAIKRLREHVEAETDLDGRLVAGWVGIEGYGEQVLDLIDAFHEDRLARERRSHPRAAVPTEPTGGQE